MTQIVLSCVRMASLSPWVCTHTHRCREMNKQRHRCASKNRNRAHFFKIPDGSVAQQHQQETRKTQNLFRLFSLSASFLPFLPPFTTLSPPLWLAVLTVLSENEPLPQCTCAPSKPAVKINTRLIINKHTHCSPRWMILTVLLGAVFKFCLPECDLLLLSGPTTVPDYNQMTPLRFTCAMKELFQLNRAV